MKRTIACLLIICLALLFTGCSYSNGKNYAGAEIYGKGLNVDSGARIFDSQYISLPEGNRAIQAVKIGERTFIYAQRDNMNCFYFMGADFSITEIGINVEDTIISIDTDSVGNIYLLSVNDDGIYVLTQISASTGCESTVFDFSSMQDNTVLDITVTDYGYLFKTADKILCYTTSGQFVKELGMYDGGFGLIKNPSELLLYTSYNNGTSFSLLSNEFDITATYEVPFELLEISSGINDGHIFAINSGIIYDIDLINGERSGFANSYASGDVGNFIYLSDNSYFSIVNGQIIIYYLDNTNNDTVEKSGEIKTLTLTTYAHEDYEILDLLDAVRGFNETNSEYRIDIVNYGMYDNSSNGSNGLKRLYTDITAGNTPDIYDLSALSYMSFYNSGLLENLYPYFDSSSNISLDELTPSIINSLEYRGALYNLVPDYTVVTMYGPSTLVDPDNWGTESFLEIVDSTSMNIFGPQVTKAEYLKYLLTFTGNEFVDTENARCDFVNSCFPKMLSVSTTLPETYDSSNSTSDDWGLIFTGQQLFTINNNASIIAGLCFADAAYCGNAANLGFPSRNNGIAVSPYLNFGMSANSECKDGVWSFFEYLLSDSYQNSITLTLPIKSAALNKHLNSCIEKFSDVKNIVGFADNIPITMQYDTMLPTAKQEAMRIINGVDCVNYCDNDLYNIVLREATPFFEGAITVEQAAQNIQSKASIYLSEQYG